MICTNCGKEQSESLFCTYCGAKNDPANKPVVDETAKPDEPVIEPQQIQQQILQQAPPQQIQQLTPPRQVQQGYGQVQKPVQAPANAFPQTQAVPYQTAQPAIQQQASERPAPMQRLGGAPQPVDAAFRKIALQITSFAVMLAMLITCFGNWMVSSYSNNYSAAFTNTFGDLFNTAVMYLLDYDDSWFYILVAVITFFLMIFDFIVKLILLIALIRLATNIKKTGLCFAAAFITFIYYIAVTASSGIIKMSYMSYAHISVEKYSSYLQAFYTSPMTLSTTAYAVGFLSILSMVLISRLSKLNKTM